MTYDPYQTYATPYATPGGYAGIGNIGNPFQTHSAAMWNPLTAYQQQPAYLQNPLIVAAQQLAQQIVAQQLAAQQNPYGQPFGFQPSLLNQQGFQPGMQHPQFGQIGFGGQSILSQGISPFGQPGSPFNQTGVPLAPQSWVGQASQLGLAQTNPVLLAQLTARALQAQGFTPGAGYQG